MAKKICKCAICGIEFDRNSIQAVKHGARRYAHQSCYPEGEPVPMEESPASDPELKKLMEYISQKYNNKANFPLIRKQIKKFHDEYHYTYSGMLKSLIYFYEVKGNRVEDSNGGVGIIEYVYDKAKEHYYKIFLAQKNADKNFSMKVKEYIIKPPKSKGNKRKILNWGEEDEIE